MYVATVEVVRANGLEIAYERVGEGPPLVFVHGAAEDGRVWQPQLAALADEFTVVAWDEPGAGRSSDVPADFGLADYADCLAALIEALALGPAHVAGLSWGGTVAQELYRHHPELVATLILVDTYAGWKGSLPEEEVRARVAGVRQMLAAPAEEFDPTLPGLFAGDPPAEFVPLLEEIAAAVRPESLRTQLFVMAEADQRDLLPRIAVPTLLIWGELDVRSPLSVARQFEQAIPDTKLVVIPGCRSRQQPRAARAVQPGRARVLPRPLAAFDLRPPLRRPHGACPKSRSSPSRSCRVAGASASRLRFPSRPRRSLHPGELDSFQPLQPLDRGPDVGEISLERRLHGRLGRVVGQCAKQVEPALGHPGRDVGLAQPPLLRSPRAAHHARPVLDAAGVGVGWAQPVLVGIVVPVGLDEAGEGCVERW